MRRSPASIRRRSARTACATASPPICSTTAPTCARCRCCWATAPCPPPRSTLWSRARSCASCTPGTIRAADQSISTPPVAALCCTAARHAPATMLALTFSPLGNSMTRSTRSAPRLPRRLLPTLLAAALLLPAAEALAQAPELNEQEYFHKRGLDVLAFSNYYDG